jgi:hypothetical protein
MLFEDDIENTCSHDKNFRNDDMLSGTFKYYSWENHPTKNPPIPHDNEN